MSERTKVKSMIYDEVEKKTAEIQQAIETLVNFSTFTESGEMGAITLKASSLIVMTLNPIHETDDRHKRFQKTVENVVVFKSLSIVSTL